MQQQEVGLTNYTEWSRLKVEKVLSVENTICFLHGILLFYSFRTIEHLQMVLAVFNRAVI